MSHDDGQEAVCVLASGGLDSGVLLAELSRDFASVFPLYVRAGLDSYPGPSGTPRPASRLGSSITKVQPLSRLLLTARLPP